MSRRYQLTLTGHQLRVLHETLSIVLNDPDWPEASATSGRDFQVLGRAHESILDALRGAESTPAAGLDTDAIAERLQADEDDPWDDRTNPLGCCADHRPGGVGSRQQHGGPGCGWPG